MFHGILGSQISSIEQRFHSGDYKQFLDTITLLKKQDASIEQTVGALLFPLLEQAFDKNIITTKRMSKVLQNLKKCNCLTQLPPDNDHDIRIVAKEGNEVRIRKICLIAKSELFARMLQNNMQEAQTKTVQWNRYDHAVIEAYRQYIVMPSYRFNFSTLDEYLQLLEIAELTLDEDLKEDIYKNIKQFIQSSNDLWKTFKVSCAQNYLRIIAMNQVKEVAENQDILIQNIYEYLSKRATNEWDHNDSTLMRYVESLQFESYIKLSIDFLKRSFKTNGTIFVLCHNYFHVSASILGQFVDAKGPFFAHLLSCFVSGILVESDHDYQELLYAQLIEDKHCFRNIQQITFKNNKQITLKDLQAIFDTFKSVISIVHKENFAESIRDSQQKGKNSDLVKIAQNLPAHTINTVCRRIPLHYYDLNLFEDYADPNKLLDMYKAILEEDQNNIYALLNSALLCYISGNQQFTKVEEYITRIIDLHPECSTAYAILSDIRLKNGCKSDQELQQIKHNLEHALELDPNSSFANIVFGSLLLEPNMQSTQETVKDALNRAILISSGKNSSLFCTLGRWNIRYMAEQQLLWNESVACYQQAIDIDPKLSDAHAELGEVLYLGAQKGFLKSCKDAKRILEETLRLDSNNITANKLLGLMYYNGFQDVQKDETEAKRYFEKIIELKAEDSSICTALAKIICSKFSDNFTEVKKAISLLRRAIKLSPNNNQARICLAEIYRDGIKFIKQNTYKAIELFEEALRFEPDNPYIKTELVKIYCLNSDAQNHSRAEEILHTLNPNANDDVSWKLQIVQLLITDTLGLLRNVELAKSYMDVIIECTIGTVDDSLVAVDLLQNKCFTYPDKDKLIENILKNVLQLDPKNIPARLLLAKLPLQLGLNIKIYFDSSVKLAKEIISLDTENLEAHVLLGELYYKNDKFNDALYFFEAATRIDPSDVRAYKFIGLMYYWGKGDGFNKDAHKAITNFKMYLRKEVDVKISENFVGLYFDQCKDDISKLGDILFSIIPIIQRALRIAPDNMILLLARGKIYLSGGIGFENKARAVKIFEKLVDLVRTKLIESDQTERDLFEDDKRKFAFILDSLSDIYYQGAPAVPVNIQRAKELLEYKLEKITPNCVRSRVQLVRILINPSHGFSEDVETIDQHILKLLEFKVTHGVDFLGQAKLALLIAELLQETAPRCPMHGIIAERFCEEIFKNSSNYCSEVRAQALLMYAKIRSKEGYVGLSYSVAKKYLKEAHKVDPKSIEVCLMLAKLFRDDKLYSNGSIAFKKDLKKAEKYAKMAFDIEGGKSWEVIRVYLDILIEIDPKILSENAYIILKKFLEKNRKEHESAISEENINKQLRDINPKYIPKI